MSYCFSKTIQAADFNTTIETVTAALKKEGFGVNSQIDIQQTLKTKIDADMNNYVILGACQPHHAFQAIQEERNIGVFLPCNVILVDLENGYIEVSAVDPVAAMGVVNNPKLGETAL